MSVLAALSSFNPLVPGADNITHLMIQHLPLEHSLTHTVRYGWQGTFQGRGGRLYSSVGFSGAGEGCILPRKLPSGGTDKLLVQAS